MDINVEVVSIVPGIYSIYLNGDLVETGIKSRREAEKAKRSWFRCVRADVVERAEKSAGWSAGA